MGCESLASSRGLYVLLIALDSAVEFRGARLEPGIYLYLGSAGGPGGLRGRICRHAGRRRRPHWHVDHLLDAGRLVGAYIREGPSGPSAERELAEALARVLQEAISGFGNTDTGGPSHLFRLDPDMDPASILGSGWRYVDLTRR
ncbi:MAG: GIY-YIG nuclease family protein [Conexivisphaera sp.]